MSDFLISLTVTNQNLQLIQLVHIALWTNHLEHLRDFYVKYFNGKSSEKYVNLKKGFASYFVSFENDPALEIVQWQDITEAYDKDHIGLAHLTFHADKKEQVDQTIKRFRMDGYTVADETRISGDGCCKGVIRDPDGNIVEIVTNREPKIQVTLLPPYELLPEADPDREKVEAYLKDSDCFIATVRNSVANVIVVRREKGRKAEIMNLTVADIFRRRGVVRKLLRHVSNKWTPAQDVELLHICTRTSIAGPMILYQQEGFDLVTIDHDYFVRNCAGPI